MKRHLFMSALVLCLVLCGCHLDGYTRSYYLAGVDQFGQRVEVGATFTPPQARAMAVRLEREGVFAPGVTLVEVSEELEVAGRQLEILRGDGTGQAGSLTPAVGQDAQPPVAMPPSLAVATVWLAKSGKLWVGSSAPEIAARRAAGWMDMPPPGFEDGFAPQWDASRGKWRVRRVAEVANAGGGL
jgi:hypothetical protein